MKIAYKLILLLLVIAISCNFMLACTPDQNNPNDDTPIVTPPKEDDPDPNYKPPTQTDDDDTDTDDDNDNTDSGTKPPSLPSVPTNPNGKK